MGEDIADANSITFAKTFCCRCQMIKKLENSLDLDYVIHLAKSVAQKNTTHAIIEELPPPKYGMLHESTDQFSGRRVDITDAIRRSTGHCPYPIPNSCLEMHSADVPLAARLFAVNADRCLL